jgi:hypothetical protein
MLSFYQMDQILRKFKAAQPVAEGFRDRFKRGPQPPVEGGEPGQPFEPEPVGGSEEPEFTPPPPANVGPAPSFDQAPPAPPVGGSVPRAPRVSGKRALRAGQSQAGAGAAPAEPTVIRSTDRDINDPDNPTFRALKAGEEVPGQRLSSGRTVSRQMNNVASGQKGAARDANVAENLKVWNGMMRSKGVSGMSTWAWMMAFTLDEMGFHNLPFENGQPFQIKFPGAPSSQLGSNAGELPEVEVPPQTFKRAVKAIWNRFGNQRSGPATSKPAQNTFDRLLSLYTKAVAPDPANPGMKQTKDQGLKEAVIRAISLHHTMFSKKDAARSIWGKTMTAAQLVHKLCQAAPLDHNIPTDDRGAGVTEVKDVDIRAGLMLLDAMKQTGMRFIKTNAQGNVTPETMITMIPLNALDNGPDAMASNEPSAGLMPDDYDDGLDTKQKAAQWVRQSKSQNGGQPPAPTMNAEANSWADLTDLMEHWGF